jgi:hypothetical protein
MDPPTAPVLPTSEREWPPERIAAERQRIIRQSVIVVVVIVLVLGALAAPESERVQGASGRTYHVVEAGRTVGAGWSGSYVRYLSRAKDQGGRDQEFADLSRMLADFAARNGDDRIKVAATRRLFRYGSFRIEHSAITRYRLVNGQWRRE